MATIVRSRNISSRSLGRTSLPVGRTNGSISRNGDSETTRHHRRKARGGARGLGCPAPRGRAPYARGAREGSEILRPPVHLRTAAERCRSVPPVSRTRVVDASVALWVVLWLVAGAYVFVAVGQLQDYGDTTITAAAGLRQTSRALGRAADGLRDTGDALEQIPFVGGEI